MFCSVFIDAAKIGILIHLDDKIHNVIVGAASAHHATQDKLGVLQQRIVVNLVDGKLQQRFLLLRIEEVQGLLVVVIQQVVNLTLRAETATKDAANIGILVFDAFDGFFSTNAKWLSCGSSLGSLSEQAIA